MFVTWRMLPPVFHSCQVVLHVVLCASLRAPRLSTTLGRPPETASIGSTHTTLQRAIYDRCPTRLSSSLESGPPRVHGSFPTLAQLKLGRLLRRFSLQSSSFL